MAMKYYRWVPEKFEVQTFQAKVTVIIIMEIIIFTIILLKKCFSDTL